MSFDGSTPRISDLTRGWRCGILERRNPKLSIPLRLTDVIGHYISSFAVKLHLRKTNFVGGATRE